MISARCKLAVKAELNKLGFHFIMVDLGEVELMEDLTNEQRDELKKTLSAIGLELMDDKRTVMVSRIKSAIHKMVYNSDDITIAKPATYLSNELKQSYASLSSLFSELQGTTIQQYLIQLKIARIKELITYNELTITEIAWKMNYSSAAHLSTQFKNATGLSPTQFKEMMDKRAQLANEKNSSTPLLTKGTTQNASNH